MPKPNGRSWFRIESKANEATVYIYDEIGAFGISASLFVDELNAVKASGIALRINSPGGDVFEGVTIYNALRRHKATITSHIDGVAASIASVVALAAQTVRIADNAFFMIHDPFAFVVGTAEDMRKTADTLDQVAKASIIGAYAKKTGKSEQEIRDWMAAETWFTADEALEAGFVDVVDTDETIKDIADISRFNFKRVPPKLAALIRAPAASGTEHKSTPPGASGTVKLIKPKPREGQMTIAEQITGFENTRAAKVARLTEITDKAATDGRTKDEAEREEFDTLTGEVESIDRELKDLNVMAKLNVEKAKPVNGNGTQAASEARSLAPVNVVREEKLEPGIEFARFAMCMGAARGNVAQALALAETHYPKQVRALGVLRSSLTMGKEPHKMIERLLIMNAAVPGATTTDATWASPLLEYNTFGGDFVEFLRAKTIIGQFGANGVPSLNRIPFNVHIKGQTSGGTAYWVRQARAKPVTKFDFNDTYHGFYKVASMTVLDEEVIRFSDPSAERLVRDAISGAVVEKIDTDFIDPAVAAVANVSPASITNGATTAASSGDDAAAVRADIQTLWAGAIAANLPLTSAVYITTPSIAMALGLMVNALGQPEFPNMTMMGGSLLGVPVIISNYVPAGHFILAFASEIWLSDDNVVTVDASREASIEMLDNPTNASDTPTATSLVSMYQTNSVAFRAERFINWSKRRTTAVAYLTSVGWGGATES